MSTLYDRQRLGKMLFYIVAIAAIVVFLVVSNNLVKELGAQERERMSIWAEATERLAKADPEEDIEFLFSIIQQNTSIPVLVADSQRNIIQLRNFPLPEKSDEGKFAYEELSPKSQAHLKGLLTKALDGKSLREAAGSNPHFIVVETLGNENLYIYYEDSVLLRRLSLYPYVQLLVMIVLAMIIYSALIYTKRAEQNRVWVGLSKETAHQLGTPISSLMAWTQYLQTTGTDSEVVEEIDKDVKRLSVIAERFSKIGSRPELQLEYINDTVAHALDYMRRRVSGKVAIEMHLSDDDHGVLLSVPLFAWVMENITKNAVDAMEGIGRIDITTGAEKDKVFVEIKDTGKGIRRKDFQNIFNPGFTTKKRGWGLGLTLVKRIIEDYHGGSIFVKESEVGVGTTFRIELPLKK